MNECDDGNTGYRLHRLLLIPGSPTIQSITCHCHPAANTGGSKKDERESVVALPHWGAQGSLTSALFDFEMRT